MYVAFKNVKMYHCETLKYILVSKIAKLFAFQERQLSAKDDLTKLGNLGGSCVKYSLPWPQTSIHSSWPGLGCSGYLLLHSKWPHHLAHKPSIY